MNLKNLTEEQLRWQLHQCPVDYLRSLVLHLRLNDRTLEKEKNFFISQIVDIRIEEKENLIDILMENNETYNKLLQ